MKITKLLGTTAMACASLAIDTSAWAQGVQDEELPNPTSEVEIESGQSAVDDAGSDGDAPIVVTGSRIRRPNLSSTQPITSIGGEEFFETGQVSIGDVLNELPALQSTFSQSNSTRFLGTSGLNLLDLRGLGTQRTLVLVNGRRHVGSDILNNAVSPDTNTFPTDLIERVDVVTGGSSAVYGSDAIAGVVNFVLKQDFEGVQVRGQGGVSKYGDAGAYFVSGVAGTNFADGRGNVAINAEYARQEQYFGSGRPNLRQTNGFLVVDTDTADPANGNSDGNPDRVFFRDIRSSTLTNTGFFQFLGGAALLPLPPGAPAGTVRAINPNAGRFGRDPAGNPYNGTFFFDPTGNLVQQTGTRVGIAPNGSFIGGNGENFRGGQQLQLAPQLDRYNVNAIGHFTFSDAFVPFFEAKYARTDVVGSGGGGPAFFTGNTLGDNPAVNRERPRLDNPFLGAQARAAITGQLLLADPSRPPTDATRIVLRENLLGLGIRREESKRETYRGVVGVRGEFNDDWQYEVSANYGEFREKTKVLGNLNTQRFLLALDAVRAPGGNIVCRSSIDSTAAVSVIDNAGILAADVAACVPVNPFGGNYTDSQRNYVLADTTSVGKITQAVASASLSGDLSQLFELPGGPVGFAVGAEYRRETNRYKQDPLVEQGFTFYNAIPTFSPPSFEVKEAFGEIRVPLLANIPFFQELTFTAAGRVSDYKGSVGTVYAYNGGVDYAPIQDLRLRANYSRSVRAPNLSELFSPPGQNFAPGLTDPCSARNIATGSANRATNCAAAGAPAGYDFVFNQSLEIVSGGNPLLTEETSDSYTVGGVLQPRFVPGLSVSVDYYDITVNRVISAVSAQTIVDQCYDQPTLNNVFCSSFTRAGAGGGPRGEIPFQILEASLLQSSLNFAKLKARGIDAEAAYRRTISGFGALSSRFTYTRNLQRDNFLNPAEPNRANQLLLELGQPKDRFSWRNSLRAGKVTVGYDMRYIGKQVLNTYEDLFSKQGRPPENADYADTRFYPSVFYHDLRLGFEAAQNSSFYLGVDNVLDRNPPLGLTGIGGGSGIYSNRGRFFYAGAVARF